MMMMIIIIYNNSSSSNNSNKYPETVAKAQYLVSVLSVFCIQF